MRVIWFPWCWDGTQIVALPWTSACNIVTSQPKSLLHAVSPLNTPSKAGTTSLNLVQASANMPDMPTLLTKSWVRTWLRLPMKWIIPKLKSQNNHQLLLTPTYITLDSSQQSPTVATLWQNTNCQSAAKASTILVLIFLLILAIPISLTKTLIPTGRCPPLISPGNFQTKTLPT